MSCLVRFDLHSFKTTQNQKLLSGRMIYSFSPAFSPQQEVLINHNSHFVKAFLLSRYGQQTRWPTKKFYEDNNNVIIVLKTLCPPLWQLMVQCFKLKTLITYLVKLAKTKRKLTLKYCSFKIHLRKLSRQLFSMSW